MSKIKPVVGEQHSATYHLDDSANDKLLENFLWKLLLVSALAYFVWSEKISINIGPLSIESTELEQRFFNHKSQFLHLLGFESKDSRLHLTEETPLRHTNFIMDPGYGARFGVESSIQQAGIRQCKLFIKKFSPVAIAEMRRTGVPASILLAQSLLASNAGADSLSLASNNFFQQECLLSDCRLEHLPGSQDTEHVCLIDVFPKLWGSFRAQSQYFENTAPYSTLLQEGEKDFKSWAYCLSFNGYSAEDQYAEKLIALIQNLQLDKFDSRA